MGCCTAKPTNTATNSAPAPRNSNVISRQKTYAPIGNPPPQTTEAYISNSNEKAYVAPQSIINPKTHQIEPVKNSPQKLEPVDNARNTQNLGIISINNIDGYPDINNYGNTSNNYLNAAGRQTTDILHDEDYGYYAANGRNVSMRVDINN